jgi:hypothetical protein
VIDPADVADAAAGLRRLLEAAEAGELDAGSSTLRRLEAAVTILEALAQPAEPE